MLVYFSIYCCTKKYTHAAVRRVLRRGIVPSCKELLVMVPQNTALYRVDNICLEKKQH